MAGSVVRGTPGTGVTINITPQHKELPKSAPELQSAVLTIMPKAPAVPVLSSLPETEKETKPRVIFNRLGSDLLPPLKR
jgi:hypothetical protein